MDEDYHTSITNTSGSAVTLSYYNYTYNSANLVSTATHSSTVGTTVYSGTNTYTYDATDQLLTTGTETFAYDANGNRNMSAYQTGVGNETTNDGTYTYSYDNAGDLIEKSKGSGLQTWYYAYDNKNDLLNVRETSDGSTNLLTITYTYDARGGQVEQDEWKSSGGGVISTRHAYEDQGTVWADVTSANAVVMRYIRGGGANQLTAQIDSSGNLWWYLTDNLSSVRDIVSAAATAASDHIDYGAFGNIVLETNSTATGRAYLYTGLPEDRDIAIIEADHRALQVTTGQWMQPDPEAFRAGDANLRRYVANNSLNSIDPTGLIGMEDSYEVHPEAARLAVTVIGNIAYNVTIGPVVHTAQLGWDLLWAWDYKYQPYNPYLAGYLNGKITLLSAVTGITSDAVQTVLLTGALARAYRGLANLARGPAVAVEPPAGAPPAPTPTPQPGPAPAPEPIPGEANIRICFLAGTPVGTTRGLRAIENVEPGTEVWAYDLVASSWHPCRVLKTFCTAYDGRIAFVNILGETIRATDLPPFSVPGLMRVSGLRVLPPPACRTGRAA